MSRKGCGVAVLLGLVVGWCAAMAGLVEAGAAERGGPQAVGTPAPPRPMKDCLECAGTGSIPCTGCGGGGKLEGDCPTCYGRGTGVCPSCDGGLVVCTKCGGRGYVLQPRVGVIKKGESRTVRVPCPARLRCAKCRGGTAPPRCPTCDGHKKVLHDCGACQGRGATECVLCAGKGSIPDYEAEAREAVAMAEREAERTVQTQLLNDLEQTLEVALARWERVRRGWIGGRVSERAENLRQSLARLSSLGELTDERELELAAVQRQWAECHAAYAGVEAAVAEGKAKEALARQKLREARSLRGELATAGRVLEGEAILGRQPFAKEYPEGVQRIEARLSDLTTSLEIAERKVSSFRRKHERYLATLEEERARQEALDTAFEGVPEAVARLAEAHEIGDARLALQDRSTPSSLRMEIRVFDGKTFVEDPARVEVLAPGDEVLSRIPAFLTDVYAVCPRARSIRLLVDAGGLDDTGHETRLEIQAFASEREKWSRLMTGEFREDWRVVLSRCSPTPEFPRRGSSLPEGWPVLVLATMAILGLAVIYVVRSRMLLH